jgi:hypothetical protein
MKIGMWDYLTFLSFAVIGIGGVAFFVLLMGLPGRIAHARKHPEAEAVNLMGWVGFLAVVPWIQALIWSIKPTNVIDIRRGPREEQEAIEEDYQKVEAAKRKKPRKKPAPASTAAPATKLDEPQ